jgi:hypothetical protein
LGKFTHVTLGLIPEIFDPVEAIFLVSKQNRVVNPIVFDSETSSTS